MKSLKSFFLGGALLLISGAVIATGNLKVHIVSAGSNQAVVHISNVGESKYEIELKNNNGDIVYYKMTNKPSTTYAKHYDFSMLENGNYNLTVAVNQEKLRTL
jgi:hypothetical protein